MLDSTPRNADALVLATAFPHASEAQQNAILTDLFVRRVALPKGADAARRLVVGVASAAQEMMRDPAQRATLLAGLKAAGNALFFNLPTDIAEALSEQVNAIFGAVPEASPPVDSEQDKGGPVYEVNVPRVVDLDSERVAETRVFLLCGDIVPGTLKAESAGDAGCLHFACDVKRGEHTRRVEGAVPSPATRAGYAPAGAMTVHLGPNPYQFCIAQPVGAFLDHQPVAVVGEAVARPCDAENADTPAAKKPSAKRPRRVAKKRAAKS